MSRKICIIGCGKVGATAGFTLAVSGMADEIVLIDKLADKARGEAMDIAHASAMTDTAVRAGGYADIKDSGVIIFAAGVGRKPGQSLMDLAATNAAIAKEAAANIKKHYTSGAVLVVTNPVDVITYIMDEALGLPKGRVIGTGTSLDTVRLKDEIAKHFKVDKSNVACFVMGEHGPSAVPVWSMTNVYGINIAEYAASAGQPFGAGVQNDLLNKIKVAGSNIIALKGATFYGITVGILGICKEILNNTNALLTVSAKLDGEYGMRGAAISLLGALGKNGLHHFVMPHIDEDELSHIRESAAIVEANIKKITKI
jgi:L-lactate dehydrogenase